MEPQQNSGTQTAAAVFFGGVAHCILTQHEPPDLRDVVVLLPNYHAAQPLAQALARVSKLPALLLPEMVTLNEWAQRIVLDQPVVPESRRTAVLYQALQSRRWFGQADLWGMAQELLALFDELTHSLSELPADADRFATAIQQAYQAKQNLTLQFESRLVFELWHAMQDGAEVDAARAYQRRLALLARQAGRPLFVLRTSDWNALEQRFLDQYAERAPVTLCDLRDEEGGRRGEFIRMALADGDAPDLRTQAAQLQEFEPLGDTLRFYAANSLEEEACTAAMQVRLWLAAGKRSIAVVAQDRVAARRVRALLERAQVLVADETGWTFATLSVSTVLMRWLDALQSDFYHHDLLDLLKSPFIFADMAAGERKSAVYQLEQLLRKHGVVFGLEKFITLAAGEAALQPPLARLREAAFLLEQNKRRSLAQWLEALHESLRVLGIDTGLKQDDAGVQLLQALHDWRQELEGDASPFRFAEWRRWLAQQLDGATYRDRGIDSPVRFTHLAATRWRSFDAVLLLGCDADHLPGMTDGGRWFNDAVRGSLGLPTRSMLAARQRDDLLALLMLNDNVLVTWQRERKGEEVLLSPFLEVLRDLHAQAYGDDLAERELHDYLRAEAVRKVELPLAAQPAPGVAQHTVPDSVSISAYNSLVACPYQFYARHILRLNELDEVPEAIEKRDYGERVHLILQRFHADFPELQGRGSGELEAALRQVSEQVFADLLQQDFEARAWLARWFKSLPAYLEWQLESEAQGWRYAGTESKFNLQLAGVLLRGRIDRIDLKDNEQRVLDYKTQSDQQLRNKLKEPGEDVQLACYAWAQRAGEAAFLSIESGKVKAVAPLHELGTLAQANIERLQQVMQQLRSGAGLPANGIDPVCGYCEMRGLCRKGEWVNG
jgi:ATP-dependent helicase/nuclease subunit B